METVTLRCDISLSVDNRLWENYCKCRTPVNLHYYLLLIYFHLATKNIDLIYKSFKHLCYNLKLAYCFNQLYFNLCVIQAIHSNILPRERRLAGLQSMESQESNTTGWQNNNKISVNECKNVGIYLKHLQFWQISKFPNTESVKNEDWLIGLCHKLCIFIFLLFFLR